MSLLCIVDEDVTKGAGAGAKFILVKSPAGFILVSKCFPAYRHAGSPTLPVCMPVPPFRSRGNSQSSLILDQLPFRHIQMGVRACGARCRSRAQAAVHGGRPDQI
jgi:hypothetical protein